MRAAFNRWLAPPSTLCFLRRLLATPGEGISTGSTTRAPTSTRPHPSRRYSQDANTPAAPSAFDHGEMTKPEESEQGGLIKKDRDVVRRRYISNDRAPLPTMTSKEESAETALSIIFGSGVNVVGDNTRPEQAYKALWLQSNVASKDHVGMLLVDKPEHKHNMKLWIHLLQYKSRIDGFAGVENLWKGMRARNVDLPVTGEDADILWTAFVNACFALNDTESERDNRTKLLSLVLEYAKDLYQRDGTQYQLLYKLIVGGLIREGRLSAQYWHRRFVNALGTSHVDLRSLLSDCIPPHTFDASPSRRRCFQKVYKSSEQRDLYDHFIPAALDKHVHQDDMYALNWHRMFIRHGDGPSSTIFALPEVQRLFDQDQDFSLPMVKNKRSKQDKTIPPDPVERGMFPPLTRAAMSTIVGNVHGIKQQEMGDSFVAKIFATQAFSLDLVIKGLGFFGIEKLGPLALREMVVKAGSLDQIRVGLEQLRDLKIRFDGSVYGRVLAQIAASDDLPNVFNALLASDQHPESFDDSAVQGSMLESYLERGLMPEAHLALLALSTDSSYAYAWNVLLQHYIQQREFGAVSKVMHRMQYSKTPLQIHTMVCLRKHMLPRRRPGQAPEKTPPDLRGLRPLQFLLNAYVYATSHGLQVLAHDWKEIMKRFGMTYRFNELERLVLWLVDTFGPNAAHARTRWQRAHAETILRQVFDWQMCEAFVAWSFTAAADKKLLRKYTYQRRTSERETKLPVEKDCEPWARGLLLLKRLKQQGLQYAADRARRALLQRLWILFGPGYSKRPKNQVAKRQNEHSLAHYIKHANEVWDRKLLPVHSSLLNEDPKNLKILLPLVFGIQRRTSKQRKERANVVLYAQFLAGGRTLPSYSGKGLTMRRNLAWKYSPFRLSTTEVGMAHYVPVGGHSPVYPVQEKEKATDSSSSSPTHYKVLQANTQPFATEDSQASSAPLADHNRPPRRLHQSRAAHSSNLHPQPNPEGTPEQLQPYSPLMRQAR